MSATIPAPRSARRPRLPKAHWILFGACLLTLVAMLMMQGISAHTIGASAEPSSAGGAVAPLGHAGPLLMSDGHGGLVSSGSSPGRQVALTFDDGPDPRWTPAVMNVLRRWHVPATFFVVGTQAVRFPDVVQAEQARGFEIANHTFTHVDPSVIAPWQARAQIDLTQSAVAGITGFRPRLFRPPYSSTPAAVTPRQLSTFRTIAGHGFVIALTNFDGEDWRRPGVDHIVASATPPTHRGGIVLLHDGGGNRSETVAALNLLIPRLLHRGFRFTTVSQLGHLSHAAAEVPSSAWDVRRGELLVGSLRFAAFVTKMLTLVVLAVGLLTVLRMGFLLLLARRHARRPTTFDVGFTPPVSIVVPAHNEEVDVAKAVTSLARSDYPRLEVIVVDDGSSDATAAIVAALDEPRVRLLRQPNRGKAVALNRGIAAARHNLIVTVDADTVFEPGTVRRLVQPFRDSRVGAVSGNTKVSNRRGLLGRWQHIEYVMGFNLDRRMYEVLGCMPTVPGAIGAFRRAALTDIGGVSNATLAEDTDVTMAIGRAGWHVVYRDDARAYTEAPSTVAGLWRQRYRWAYGTLQSIWKHKDAIVHGDRGSIGRRAIPYLALFQIILPFAAPLIDLFALYGIIFLDPLPVMAYWLAFNLLQLGLAIYAFRLDGEPLRPLWAMPLQQFVYRQIMYLVVFESAASALRGVALGWQHVARSGDLQTLEEGAGRR